MNSQHSGASPQRGLGGAPTPSPIVGIMDFLALKSTLYLPLSMYSASTLWTPGMHPLGHPVIRVGRVFRLRLGASEHPWS